MNNRRRSKIKQSEVRKKKFAHDHYWCIGYTQLYHQGEERDFRVIIKARSSELAKEILKTRLLDDDNFKKTRSITCSMIHECWYISTLRKPLTIGQWESIRNVSFPNDWNRLFKFEKKRIKGQTNRFNVPPTVLSPQHKKKLRDAANKLVNKYVRGTFKPLCPELKKECHRDAYKTQHGQRKGFASIQNKRQAAQELSFLKKTLKDCHGNIQWAADTSGIERSGFYRALNRFPEVDWRKDFPLTQKRVPLVNSMHKPGVREKLAATLKKMGHAPPLNRKGSKNYKKWKDGITATWHRKHQENLNQWKPRIIEALRKFDHKRAESAGFLGISIGHLLKLMRVFRKEDPTFTKEFCSADISLRLRKASYKRTLHHKRLDYLKKNKDLILQAYYQNGEMDCKGAKAMRMDTRTFRRCREEIKHYEL